MSENQCYVRNHFPASKHEILTGVYRDRKGKMHPSVTL